MPYVPATMSRSDGDGSRAMTFASQRRGPQGRVQAAWAVGAAIADPSPLQTFFVERYFVFTTLLGRVVRGQVTHEPWPLHEATVTDLDFDLFELHGFKPKGEPLALFSPG